MTKPNEQNGEKEAKPSRGQEALRLMEEYAEELREFIRKLRRKMNQALGTNVHFGTYVLTSGR